MTSLKTVSRIVAGIWLALCLGSPAHAQADSSASGEFGKEALVTAHASGTFDVKLTPQATVDDAEGASLGRMSIEKQFHGDLALLKSMTSVKGLRADPSPDVARRIALAWAPWRSIAARILWHDYLARRRAGDRPGRP